MTTKINSIEQIEECLEMIYNYRKSSLLAKSRKHKEKEDRLLRNNSNSNNRQQFVKSSFEYEEDDEDLDEDLQNMKELSVKFAAPPPKAIPITNRKSTPYTKGDKADLTGETSQNECDVIAESAFNEFCLEITTWLNNHSKDVINDDDIRSEFADGLVHTYLSSNLDRLPSSKRVSEIRRLISNTIEDFVSSGSIKLNVSAMKQQNAMTRTLSEQAISNNSTTSASTTVTNSVSDNHNSGSNINGRKQSKVKFVPPSNQFSDKSKNSSTSNSSNSNGKGQNKNIASNLPTETAVTAVPVTVAKTAVKQITPEEKALMEKKKIKQQYEQFMTLKKKTEMHPDHETVQQYTELNDDIQSLLNSLQQKK